MKNFFNVKRDGVKIFSSTGKCIAYIKPKFKTKLISTVEHHKTESNNDIETQCIRVRMVPDGFDRENETIVLHLFYGNDLTMQETITYNN